MQFEGTGIALTCNAGEILERERERERERECVCERERERERERLKPKRGQFRSLAVKRVLRLSAARLHHTIVETATEQIQASTAARELCK